MYRIDKKYGNLNRKIYIDSNLEHLLASNFTGCLFLKCLNAYKILHDISNFYFRQIFSKISEEKCCFLNNIFHKCEIVVCFAPLLHGFDQPYPTPCLQRRELDSLSDYSFCVRSFLTRAALHAARSTKALY